MRDDKPFVFRREVVTAIVGEQIVTETQVLTASGEWRKEDEEEKFADKSSDG